MNKTSTLSLAIIAMFAALSAIGGFMKIPLPFVPLTMQVPVVLLAGSLLGSKKGFFSQLVYVGIGLAGLPVFTQGGGFGYIFQPTFGYLIGFIVAAFVVGWIVEKTESPNLYQILLAFAVGLIVVYLIGVPYLYMAMNYWLDAPTSIAHVLMIGFVYSIGGDVVSAIVAAILAKRLFHVFEKVRNKQQQIQIKEERTV